MRNDRTSSQFLPLAARSRPWLWHCRARGPVGALPLSGFLFSRQTGELHLHPGLPISSAQEEFLSADSRAGTVQPASCEHSPCRAARSAPWKRVIAGRSPDFCFAGKKKKKKKTCSGMGEKTLAHELLVTSSIRFNNFQLSATY